MINIQYGYIVSVTSDSLTVEIQHAIASVPPAPDGYAYRLKADTIQWELYEFPSVTEDDEITAEEALEIIRGGAV